MKILGVSPAHDSSACLYEDGKIVSFYKEERISRKKRDKFPILAIQKVLENVKHIDLAVYCGVVKNDYYFENFSMIVKKFVECDNIIDFSDYHHLQHASNAFYNSGFESAAVIVADRNGSVFANSSRESETIFNASYPNNFEEVYKSLWIFDSSIHGNIKSFSKDTNCEYDAKSMFGIVKVYETATTLIGQHVLENGKTMGLSAYGKENINCSQLFVENTNIPNDFYLSHDENYEAINYQLNSIKTDNVNLENYQIYADYAWEVQKQTQDAMCYLIKKAVEKTRQKNIVISGGYGMNVVANKYYLDNFPELNFYFEPLSDDSGNSIGGSMFFYREYTKDSKIIPIKDTFFHGKKYEIDKNIGQSVSIEDMAKMIVDNKSIAIYQGMAEAGPRALGHRSILFNAMNDDAKKIVNKIKKREWYRPFAAVVLEEDASKYFDIDEKNSSPFMTVSFVAHKNIRHLFKGVIHIDGTCRIQTVGKDMPVLYKLLQEIKNITGHGIILNTSFNLAGQPLVETPDDAINTLQNSEIDVLWFADIERAIIKNKIKFYE